MAELYRKRLETQRKVPLVTCRFKALGRGSRESLRIAEPDRLIVDHIAKPAGQKGASLCFPCRNAAGAWKRS